MNHEDFMRRAIEEARKGIEEGQLPFGACIAKDGKVISIGHNTVKRTMDVTAHAEMNAIRMACKKKNTTDLTGAVMYATCEPCPMCKSACDRAKIFKIFFGIQGHDIKKSMNEPPVTTEVVGNFLKEENLELLNLWYEKFNKAEGDKAKGDK